MLPAAALALLLVASTASPSVPCYQSLKFGGSLYIDTDQSVGANEVGPPAGVTDPNAARCGLPDRLAVYRHSGHLATDEVLYREPDGRNEVFRTAGQAGFPLQDLRWIVLALVLAVVLLMAVPAILAHVRARPENEDLTSDP